MNERTKPDMMTWPITPKTALKGERAQHELDGDVWVIEIYDSQEECWDAVQTAVRLALYRAVEDD